MQETRNITIKDVAKKAGVAVSTVSRVLNNLDRVSDDTRQKVQNAIDELHFTVNKNAASIVTGHNRTILIIIPNFIYNFFGTVVNGAESRFTANGYSSLIVISKSDSETIENTLKHYSNLIDGALIIPDCDSLDFLKSFSKPFVLVDHIPLNSSYNTVSVDNQKDTSALTELLISKGHERIAIIADDNRRNSGKGRLDGYLKTMKKHNLSVKEEYICKTVASEANGYSNTEKLLNLKEKPTAIIATDSKLCLGCVSYFNSHNLVSGKDISLACFEDSDLAKAYSGGITAIFTPKEKMGIIAADKLLALISNPEEETEQIIVESELRIRNSVASIK